MARDLGVLLTAASKVPLGPADMIGRTEKDGESELLVWSRIAAAEGANDRNERAALAKDLGIPQ
jgi:hypothetical protein